MFSSFLKLSLTSFPSGLAAASVVSRGGTEDETHITLALDWAMNWGTWGPQEFCPEGTFAYAFEIKVRTYSVVCLTLYQQY